MVTFDPETGCDPYTFTLENTEPGEHIYEIWLPNMCEAEITFLEIDDGASLYPVLHSGSPVIAIGDSITQGMTSSSPSRCYAALLSKALKRDLFNLSVGGAEMKKEVGSLALAYNWSSAIVAFGVNDYFHKRPLADFEADTRGTFRHYQPEEHANSYIITPIPCMQTAGKYSKYP